MQQVALCMQGAFYQEAREVIEDGRGPGILNPKGQQRLKAKAECMMHPRICGF